MNDVDVNELFRTYSVEAITEVTAEIMEEPGACRYLNPQIALGLSLLLTVDDDLMDIVWSTELPLFLALNKGEAELQHRLLKKREQDDVSTAEQRVVCWLPADITNFSVWGTFSFLEAAVLAGDLELLQKLPTAFTSGIIRTACSVGDLAIVQAIFENEAPSHRAAACSDALIPSTESLNLKLIQFLFKTGGHKINLEVKRFNEPLMLIAAKTGSGGVVQLLLAHGVACETKNAEGVSPLHLAAKEGHIAVVKVLLNSSHANISTENKQSAFLEAVALGRLDVVECFLQVGCDPDYISYEIFSVTPLIMAVKRRQLPVAERLLKAGANPNIPLNGTNAYSIALSRADTPMVTLLGSRGGREWRSDDRLQLDDALY